MVALRSIVCAALALSFCTALAQSDSASAAPDEAVKPTEFPCTPPPFGQNPQILKDHPFSGKLVASCKMTLADGTVFTAKDVQWLWRDSLGRIRIETTNIPLYEGGKRHYVSVIDPVAHVSWNWSVQEEDKTAFKERLRPGSDSYYPVIHHDVLPDGTLDPPIFARMLNPGPREKQIILKPTYINGVWTEGERLIRIVAPGEDNNKSSHAETVISETWWSPDLFLEIRELTDDPELGKQRIDLLDIDEADPDRALFRPPEGWALIDATPKNPAPRKSPFVIIPADPSAANSPGASTTVVLSAPQ